MCINQVFIIMKNSIKIMLLAGFFVTVGCKQSDETQTNTTESETTQSVGQEGVKDDASNPNIVQVASGSKDHTTLVAAVKAAGLVETHVEIPFLINMGWSFFFTMLIMIVISLAGPKVNPKAFALDKEMFKIKPSTMAMIVITLLILTALYAKFW